MTNARKTTGPRAASGERRAARVWRFVDWEGRFAPGRMPDHHEVGKYVKWHINAWQGSEGAWITAMNRLRADKEWIWMQGAVVELLAAAMNQTPEYQGFLVTRSNVPMTASDVGSMLRVDGRKALAVLTRCEAVGILERVAWPSRNHGPDGGIPDNYYPDSRCLRLATSRSCHSSPKTGENPRFCGGKRGPPFNKSEKVEKAAAQQESKLKDSDEGTPACAGGARLTCPRCGHVGKAAKAAKGWGAKAVQCTQCGHVTRAESRNPIPTTSISTPAPPTKPDGGEGPDSSQAVTAGDSGRYALPASDLSPGPNVVRLDEAVAGQVHRYSAEGNAFGEQVLAALGYTWQDRSEYRVEVAHWAKLWEQASRALSGPRMARMQAKVMRVAGQLRAGQLKANNPMAFLLRTMQNEIKDARRAGKVQTG